MDFKKFIHKTNALFPLPNVVDTIDRVIGNASRVPPLARIASANLYSGTKSVLRLQTAGGFGKSSIASGFNNFNALEASSAGEDPLKIEGFTEVE